MPARSVALFLLLLPLLAAALVQKVVNISCSTCMITECQSGYYYKLHSQEINEVICVERGKLCNTSLAAQATIRDCAYDYLGKECARGLCFYVEGVYILSPFNACTHPTTIQMSCSDCSNSTTGCSANCLEVVAQSQQVVNRTWLDRNTSNSSLPQIGIHIDRLPNVSITSQFSEDGYITRNQTEIMSRHIVTSTNSSTGTTISHDTTIMINQTNVSYSGASPYMIPYVTVLNETLITITTSSLNGSNPINTVSYYNYTTHIRIDNYIKYYNHTQVNGHRVTHNRTCTQGCNQAYMLLTMKNCTRDHFGDAGTCCYQFEPNSAGGICFTANRLFNSSLKIARLLAGDLDAWAIRLSIMLLLALCLL